MSFSAANESLTSALTMSKEAPDHGGDFEVEIPRAVWAPLGKPEPNQQVSGWGGARKNSGGFRPGAGRKPKIQDPPPQREPEVERWYCVCTKPGRDLAADIGIRLAGFHVFAPTIWKPAIAQRRDAKGVVHPALPDRIEPLFRRYLFARFDRTDFSWTKILHLDDEYGAPVQRIISSSLGSPIAVPDSVIEAIQARAHANGCLYPHMQASAARLAKGTRVRPTEGAFTDLVGSLAEMSDGKRVRVLLQIMGREVPVGMDQSAVEVVE